jgi:hypothetical protein
MGVTGNFYNVIKDMYLTTKTKIKLPTGLSSKCNSDTEIKKEMG